MILVKMSKKEVLKKEVLKGGVVKAKTSLAHETGDWGTKIPLIDEKKCIHCMECVAYCPDSALKNIGGKRKGPDLRYCKGCGLCAKICPVKAIKMINKREL